MKSTKTSLDDLRIHGRDSNATSSRAWLYLGGVVLLILVGGLVWWQLRAGAVEVTTALARQTGNDSSDRTVLNASGYVTARRQATVSSKVTGKVVDILIEEGMEVEEGQVLAHLDDSNTRANLAVAEAQIQSAQAATDEARALLKQAEQEFRRITALAERSIASQADLDQGESQAMALRARLARQRSEIEVAQRQVALWQQQMEDMVIRAPFTGIVTTKNAQPGEMISPVSAGGGFTRTGIGTIVDMDSLEIEIDVNESYINRVKPGQPVEATLDAYADWKIPCKVIATIPTADRQKSTVRVRVGFDELDSRVLPQMAVKVAFHETDAEPAGRAVTVPRGAVREDAGRDVVFVVRNGHVERRAVTVGGSRSEDVLLTAGVTAGEKIVVASAGELEDGTAVKEREP